MSQNYSLPIPNLTYNAKTNCDVALLLLQLFFQLAKFNRTPLGNSLRTYVGTLHIVQLADQAPTPTWRKDLWWVNKQTIK
jgi:hypothetical protein